MIVSKLRKLIKDTPDDYQVMMEYKDFSKGNCPSGKMVFSGYVQKKCYAQLYTGNTLMIIEG